MRWNKTTYEVRSRVSSYNDNLRHIWSGSRSVGKASIAMQCRDRVLLERKYVFSFFVGIVKDCPCHDILRPTDLLD